MSGQACVKARSRGSPAAGLRGGCIVLAVHRFVEHVLVMTSEAGHFLLQPSADLSHRVLMTLSPQVVLASERKVTVYRRMAA